jgi:uncharacterized protein (TIGR02996 family)
MLEAAFWQAIQEAPDDDAPRLIYADWLEESGGEASAARAEYIRVQCELARLPEDDDRRAELQLRETTLWKKHGKTWGAPLRPFSHKFAFRRGFPDQVLVQGQTFLDHAEQVLAAAPVFSIRLRNAKAQIEGLANCPALRRLIALSFYWNHIGLNRARTFFQSPNLDRLSELDLDDNSIKPGGLSALVAGHLPRLTTLNLRRNDLGDTGVEALAASPLLAQLRDLNLSRNGIGEVGVRALAASPGAASLVKLNLSLNKINDTAVSALAESPHLGRLQHLDLASNSIRQAGLEALVGSDLFTRLVSLDLGYTPLSVAGESNAEFTAPLPSPASATGNLRTLNLNSTKLDLRTAMVLGSSPLLSGVTHLNLQHTRLDAPRLRALFAPGHLSGLRVLNLNSCLADSAAAALAQMSFPGLRKLSLGTSRFGNDLLEALAEAPLLAGVVDLYLGGTSLREAAPLRTFLHSPYLTQLRTLNLDRCHIGNDGAKVLADAPVVAGVHTLSLNACEIGPAGFAALAGSAYLSALRTLDLGRNPIGDAGAEALAASPHLGGLHRLTVSTKSQGFRVAGLSAAAVKALTKRFGRSVCVFL